MHVENERPETIGLSQSDVVLSGGCMPSHHLVMFLFISLQGPVYTLFSILLSAWGYLWPVSCSTSDFLTCGMSLGVSPNSQFYTATSLLLALPQVLPYFPNLWYVLKSWFCNFIVNYSSKSLQLHGLRCPQEREICWSATVGHTTCMASIALFLLSLQSHPTQGTIYFLKFG